MNIDFKSARAISGNRYEKKESKVSFVPFVNQIPLGASKYSYLKLLGKSNVTTNMRLEILNTVKTKYKPKLESSESST